MNHGKYFQKIFLIQFYGGVEWSQYLRFVFTSMLSICPSTDEHLIDKSYIEFRALNNQESKTAQSNFFHQKWKKLVPSSVSLQIPQLSVSTSADMSPCKNLSNSPENWFVCSTNLSDGWKGWKLLKQSKKTDSENMVIELIKFRVKVQFFKCLAKENSVLNAACKWKVFWFPMIHPTGTIQ